MADESNASYQVVRESVEVATSLAVGENAPPEGVDGQPEIPCCVISLNRDVVVSYQNGVRAMVKDAWLAKYIGPADGSSDARLMSDAIDEQLTGVRNAPGPYGTTVYSISRTAKVRYTEYVQDGPDLVHRGGIYEVKLLPASG